MEFTTTRIIDAPIDIVWSLQLAHMQWPQHLPNFRTVVRHCPDAAFGIGSSASITQPGLGTVRWTVDDFLDTPSQRSFTWSGSAKGATYAASHLVDALDGGRTRLTLGIRATGPFITLLGWMVKGRMQTTIDHEGAAFEQWAMAVASITN